MSKVEKKQKEGKEITDSDIAGGEAAKQANLENVNPQEFIQKLKDLNYKIRVFITNNNSNMKKTWSVSKLNKVLRGFKFIY